MAQKKSKGFSLLEILISIAVVLILLILSAVLVPSQITKAKDARIKRDLHYIYLYLEDFYDSQNKFPDSLPSCDQPLIYNDHVYIPNIPCDPFDKSSYLYQSGSDAYGKWFKLYANLRNKSDRIISLVGCSKGCGPQCKYNYGVTSTNITIDRCSTPTPTPTPIKYACSPGGVAKCEQYDNPTLSQCPKVYENDPTCQKACSVASNRCKNASGKHKPD